MPFNGSGVYSAPSNSWNPAVAGASISAADWAAQLADYVTAWNTCLLKDGTQAATAIIPFASGITLAGGSTLANYVEQTWTPTLIGSGTAGTQTYVAQVGRYTRIGNYLFISGYVEISNKDAAMAGNVLIGGFPIAASNVSSLRHGMAIASYKGVTFDAGFTELLCFVNPNTQLGVLFEGGSNQTSTNVAVTNLANASLVAFAGVYRVGT